MLKTVLAILLALSLSAQARRATKKVEVPSGLGPALQPDGRPGAGEGSGSRRTSAVGADP